MMFTSDYLIPFVRTEDLELDPKYSVPNGAALLAADAALIAIQGFDSLVPRKVAVKKKPVFIISSAPTLVLLRALNRCLADAISFRPPERDTIIRRLSSVLAEGVLHRVHKFDVRSFFETIDTDRLMREMRWDTRIPRVASLVIERFFARMTALGILGVPRGIPLSTTMAEYAMRHFDELISHGADVYYYARFVDDIVVVTGARSSEAKFHQFVTRALPPGLRFNTSKSKCVALPVNRQGGTASIGTFDFLGYGFELFETQKKDKRLVRPVVVSISGKKVTRLKTRVYLSLASFAANGDFSLLQRRFQLLTGNYNVRDSATRQSRNVGLYCNYRVATDYSRLKEVDALARALSVGTGALATKVRLKLSSSNRRQLLTHSFFKSFETRPFYNFSAKELGDLRKCWHHA